MRAFLAASPDDALRTVVGTYQQRLLAAAARSPARITWTRPDAIHLTFRFFADLDAALVEPLRAAIRPVTTRTSAIHIPLSRLGAFPRTDAPRVLWLGPPPEWESTPAAREVRRLEAAIRDACAGLGIAVEDAPWRPHLTLARIRDDERAAGRAWRDAGCFDGTALRRSFVVDAVSLIRSDVGPAGHTHTTLWTELLRHGA